MAMKDISDRQVCEAFRDAKAVQFKRWPYDLLMERTGQPFKVCYRAMERADDRGLVDFGVSLRTGWLTEAGEALLQPSNDAEVLDEVARQFAGDAAVEACIAECRAALDSEDLVHRMALAKKLVYACATKPLEAPTPNPLVVALGTRTLQ